MRPLPQGQVNILASGDWGEASKAQLRVAETMSKYVASTGLQFDCSIAVGDNSYIRIKDLEDPTWNQIFEDVYDPHTLNFPFYLVLGNHDYEQDRAKLEINYTFKYPHSRWKLPAKWYRVDLPADKPLVTMLMLDSNKPRMTKLEWTEQMQWLEAQLKSPRARWTLSVTHHPFYSNGSHGDIPAIQAEWGDLFRKYGSDFYLAGHDHDLQHIEVKGWPMSFMQVGGGARQVTDMRRDDRGPFSRRLWGFAQMNFTQEIAHITYIDGVTGKVAHEFEKTKDGNVRIIRTTGRDRATAKPVTVPPGLVDPLGADDDEQ